MHYLHCPVCTLLTKRPSEWTGGKAENCWENCIGWLCFRWRCMFVVLPRLVATVLQQMRHTGLHRLSGSPVIWFEPEMLPHGSCCVRLWNKFQICFLCLQIWTSVAIPYGAFMLHSVREYPFRMRRGQAQTLRNARASSPHTDHAADKWLTRLDG